MNTIPHAWALPFILAGHAEFILSNIETGNQHRYKVVRYKESDNYKIYHNDVFIGTLARVGDTCTVYMDTHEQAKAAKPLCWYLEKICNHKPIPEKITLSHLGMCGRCGKLNLHLEYGLGSTCSHIVSGKQ